MQPIHTSHATSKLPSALEPLRKMVSNLWRTWQPDARKLIRDGDFAPRTLPANSAGSFRSRI